MTDGTRFTPWPFDDRIRLGGGNIPADDAERQTETARAILERLADRPGVVLADEVGMGKTFVALAVAASAAYASGQPVVVMVPPRLLDKWKRDINRFRESCFMSDGAGRPEDRLRFRKAESGAAFLACFDDEPDHIAHIVLLVSAALHRSERDPFVRLEAMHQALVRGDKSGPRHRVLARRAHALLRSASLRGIDERQIEQLLKMPCTEWRRLITSWGIKIDDDPVPDAFQNALHQSDLAPLREALELVPANESKFIEDRLRLAREQLNVAMRTVWSKALKIARIRSPLLIFDEAHHLKNPDTRLGSLFLDSESGDTSLISGAFDRMLFLTATPFQLGHRELLEVLRRFLAVSPNSIGGASGLQSVRKSLDDLGSALDKGQLEALHLDRLWSQLRPEDLSTSGDSLAPDGWWSQAVKAAAAGSVLSPNLTSVLSQHERTRLAMRQTEELLRPWVLRHLRPRMMKSADGVVSRRIELPGRAIEKDAMTHAGIEISAHSRFPFLLCARAQSVLARQPGKRAYFAEGLASSYDAFLETSAGGRPVDDDSTALEESETSGEAQWYLANVKEFVRRDGLQHPKIEPTVRKALELWKRGEKVLIFGHFRMTIRALAHRMNGAVNEAVARMACVALGLDVAETKSASSRVERIVQRLQDRESPLRSAVRENLARWTKDVEHLTEGQREQVIELLLATLATPSFVVRNFPLDRPEVRASLEDDRPTSNQARAAADAVAESLSRRSGTRLAYRARVKAFLDYLTSALTTDEERDEALQELRAGDKRVVRHASGEVEPETRRRLLLGFNSPLLPEILIASEVMAEGLDLHLDCRHIIHHDLSWNPSTLEQRTGRVDRLRCLAEQEGESIVVYLPYLEGTADEKMYRVVTDRARWFQVVMGEQYEVDEHSTDAIASRIPFPDEAARDLTLDLSADARSAEARSNGVEAKRGGE